MPVFTALQVRFPCMKKSDLRLWFQASSLRGTRTGKSSKPHMKIQAFCGRLNTAHQEAADFPTQAEAPFGEYASCLHVPLQRFPMHDAYMGIVMFNRVCLCVRKPYSETEATVCLICSRFWMLQQPMQLPPTNINDRSSRTRHPRLLQESLEDDATWIKEPNSSPFLHA